MIDHAAFNHIKALLFDVDGVLTNSDVLIMDDGSLLRNMNVKDGMALKQAKEAGYIIGILTKGGSQGVRIRLEALGVDEFYDKLPEKMTAFYAIKAKYQLQKSQILYMGDDIADLPVFSEVGISSCPRDAANDVLVAADYISPKDGGKGCVRDIIERVMRIQGTWSLKNHVGIVE